MDRRSFLKLGSLFVAAAVAPTVAYSFLTGRRPSLFGLNGLTEERVEVPFLNGRYEPPAWTTFELQDLILSGPIVLTDGCDIDGCVLRPAHDFVGDTLLDARRLRDGERIEVNNSVFHCLGKYALIGPAPTSSPTRGRATIGTVRDSTFYG